MRTRKIPLGFLATMRIDDETKQRCELILNALISFRMLYKTVERITHEKKNVRNIHGRIRQRIWCVFFACSYVVQCAVSVTNTLTAKWARRKVKFSVFARAHYSMACERDFFRLFFCLHYKFLFIINECAISENFIYLTISVIKDWMGNI